MHLIPMLSGLCTKATRPVSAKGINWMVDENVVTVAKLRAIARIVSIPNSPVALQTMPNFWFPKHVQLTSSAPNNIVGHRRDERFVLDNS
jgi:hypothetical protein